MPKTITAQEVPGLIDPGHRVFVQGGVGEPGEIIAALADAPGNTGKAANHPVQYFTVSIPGVNSALAPRRLHRGAHLHSTFMHPGLDQGDRQRRISFLPMHYRDTQRFLQAGDRFDVAVIQVAPPDDGGYCSLGISVDFVPTILERCACLVAEINPQMPSPPHSPKIAHAMIDYEVLVDHALPSTDSASPGEKERAIARHVAELINDGDCIQIGIGRLPTSILQQLKGHRRLGLHSGLISDGVRDLIESGVMTGECKSIDRGRHVAGMAWGSAATYRWLDSRPDIAFQPVEYTHDLRTLAAIDSFVSINSVLEIDLHGQANAETINAQQVSATGGLVDFARGARASRGGKSILALPATAMAGSRSRIVTGLSGGIATLCRADIDYVVTEFGSASLFGGSIEARARSLVDIAAPGFREQLWQAWENT